MSDFWKLEDEAISMAYDAYVDRLWDEYCEESERMYLEHLEELHREIWSSMPGHEDAIQ